MPEEPQGKPKEEAAQAAPAPETPIGEIHDAAAKIADGLNRLGAATPVLIEAWWHDWFPNTPVSRDSAAWNWAYQAKEDLKKRLAAV